jgi:RNA recognition motif-containing protein
MNKLIFIQPASFFGVAFSYTNFMNILVSNLSVNVINDDLNKLFSLYGEVSFVVVVRDRKSGRSKGNAFVEMPQEAQGVQAILGLHQKEVDGTIISVQEIIYRAGEFNN